MKKKRRNEIAWRYVKGEMKDEGVDTFDPKRVKKSIKRFARLTGISNTEAYVFSKSVVEGAVRGALNFTFGKKKKKRKKK
ncbi:MAG: hypothetical protein WC819_02910 [Parcubacteria group bacterium]